MMFRIPILLFFILLPAMLAAAETDPDSAAVTDTLNIRVRVYEVFGMDCPGCHGGIEKLVNKVPAVINSEANWEKQELRIWIDPAKDVKDEDIIDAIERANLTPGERIK
jgi:copper chaperone CopZ